MARTAQAYIALVTISLAACGGGGNGGGGTISTAPLAEITSANAPAISSAVMSSMLEGGDLGAFAGLTTGAGTGSLKGELVFAKVGALQTGAIRMFTKQRQLGIFQAPIEPMMEECLGGGTLTMSGDLQNPGTLTQGDTITFEYDECSEGTTVVHGTFAMTITSFSGDLLSGTFSFGVDVDLSGFRVLEDGELATADGEVSITLSAAADPSLEVSVRATTLTVGANGTTSTMTDFVLTQQVDSQSGNYLLDASGSLTSSDFSGRVNFETTVSFQGTGDGNAFSGELVITGAAQATIHISVLDGTMLRLAIDTNGDGNADETMDRSWDELT